MASRKTSKSSLRIAKSWSPRFGLANLKSYFKAVLLSYVDAVGKLLIGTIGKAGYDGGVDNAAFEAWLKALPEDRQPVSRDARSCSK